MDKKYVVGFAFDINFRNVLLIIKNRPEWQKGLLNGIGGSIKIPFEFIHEAMVREFQEETGIETGLNDWNLQVIEKILDTGATIFFFSIILNKDRLNSYRRTTDEQPKLIPTLALQKFPIIKDLSWLIPLILDEAVNKPIEIIKENRGN